MAFNPNDHMMKLKGRDYLQVMWRLVWFRDEHPDWSIDTSIIEADPEHAVFRAVICDENGVQKCAGHGSESKRDFGDYLEKAETKAVGRALAMLGYGTQFTATELDEGERIVDSPVTRNAPQTPEERRSEIDKVRAAVQTCERCGKVVKGGQLPDKTMVTAAEIIAASKRDFNGACYCYHCQQALRQHGDETA